MQVEETLAEVRGERVRPGGEKPLFESCGRRPPRPWTGLALSILLHCAGLSFLYAAGPYLDILATETEPLRLRVVPLEPLRLEIPERTFVAQAASRRKPPPERPAGPRASAAGRRGPAGGRAGELAEPTGAGAQRAGARPFELPQSRRPDTSAHVILQPLQPPRLPLPAEAKLPTLLLWASPKIPPPPPRRFVAPGSQVVPEAAPVLDAPPRLEPPNRELALSDLRIASSPVFDQPKLPRPPASVAPVRQFVPPAAERTVAPAIIESLPGEPINVLALSDAPAPVSRMLVLPAGSFAGSLAPPGAGSSLAGTAAEGTGVAQSGAEGASAGSGTAAGVAGTGAGGGTGGAGAGAAGAGGAGAGAAGPGGAGPYRAGSGAGASGSGPGSGLAAGSGSGAGTGRASPSGRPGLASGLPSSVATRVEHPVTAVFDVVVEGGSPAPGDRQSRGILSGRPIYTVYLPVAPGKPWLMQYCVPNQSVPTRVTGGVVSLGTTAPVRAPYPRTTVVPPAELLPATGSLLIHGYISAGGEFEELRAVNAEQTAALLPLLSYFKEWIFRPAVQGGGPVRVEILLVIPPAAR